MADYTYMLLSIILFIFRLLQIKANQVFYIDRWGYVKFMHSFDPYDYGIDVGYYPDDGYNPDGCYPAIDIDVGVGDDTYPKVYATFNCGSSSSPNYKVYQFIYPDWQPIGGSLERIAVCNDYNVYGVNKNGYFYKRRYNDNNDYWDQKDGSNFIDVACGDRGSYLSVWGVTSHSTDNLWKYDTSDNDWVRKNNPKKLVQISVGGVGGWVWGIADDDNNGYGPIYGTSDGANTWYQVQAKNEAGYLDKWKYVEIGYNGRKYAIDTNGDLYYMDVPTQWKKAYISESLNYGSSAESGFVAWVERDSHDTNNGVNNYGFADFLNINYDDDNDMIKIYVNNYTFIYAFIGICILLVILSLFNLYWYCSEKKEVKTVVYHGNNDNK